jgi:hypothetical protein
MWEYKRIQFTLIQINEISTELERIGKEDWEIIYYQENKPIKHNDLWHIVMLLKRKKQ